MLFRMLRFLSLLFFLLLLEFPVSASKVKFVLTQKMIDEYKDSFVIKKDYDLSGNRVIIPRRLRIVFDGGSLDNGEVCGTNTIMVLTHQKSIIFGKDIIISGTWNISEVYDSWFAFDKSDAYISNRLIKNVLAFSNDRSFCHIVFDENRTYFFELPYHGGGYLGEKVSFKMVDGKKKRKYADLLSDRFAYLRIFTIPSNTRLTINNTWKMLPTEMGAYFVFWEKLKKNITIDGNGKICGDARNHLYTQPFNIDSKRYFGEWGMIFEFISCNNIKLSGITIEGAFGDCLYFSSRVVDGIPLNKQIARGLQMNNVKIRYGRRNGVVIGAQDVMIRNCTFENCGIDEINGTQPWAAIDFESDDFEKNKFFYCYNVQLKDCKFRNNRIDVNSCGITNPEFGKYAVTISNCTFPNPVSVNSSHWIRFKRCYLTSLKSGNNKFSMFTSSTNLLFEDCIFEKIDRVRQARSLLKGNRFKNCRIINE